MKKQKGIYKIINKINNKFYIGSTSNFHVRKLRHLNELRKNKHHCIHLQRAFNKYKEENFEVIFIEECENTFVREQEILDSLNYRQVYNVSSKASGGFLIENHPNKEKILQKCTEILLKNPRPLGTFNK